MQEEGEVEASLDEEDKSSKQSQEKDESSRVNGLGRSRKKKVFADYYYGDDIFTKAKNANKKEKPKQVKNKRKAKLEKPKKVSPSANGNKGSSSNTAKSDEPPKEKTIKIKCEANGNKFAMQTLNSFPTLNQLAKEISSRDMNYGKSFQSQLTMPVKPIPQRHNGSKLGFLMNAYKIHNEAKTTNGYEESRKKRDEKAFSKDLENILSQENNPLMSSNRSELLGNVQNTLNAILNMN